MHNRKSPRAPRYDYNSEGCYFITIVTKNREHYFGTIVDGKMILNGLGRICEQEIIHISQRKSVDIHAHIVMPNHIHMIVCISNFMNEMNIGYCRDGLVGRPHMDRNNSAIDNLVGRPHMDRNNDNMIDGRATSTSLQHIIKHGKYNGPLLGNIINTFKGNVTKYANANNIPFARQSRYHDHIIRNSTEYDRIAYYVQTNPQHREKDSVG